MFLVFFLGFAGFSRQLRTDEVQVNNCQTGTCKLKRKTNATIMLKFVADHKYKEIKTTVYAKILELPLPFIGVDGTSKLF
jgi:Niemann-Pick C2 protein